MNDVSIVERLDLRFVPRPWPFAAQRRAEIDAHFAALQAREPRLWNGRVLLMHEHSFDGGVLRGAYLETDFASFNAWRSWGWPETGIRNCFGASALISADGAVLLGVMGAHTVNAGQVYFPCGTPEAKDIVDGRIDLDRSAARELTEETGIDVSTLVSEPSWVAVSVPGEIAMIKLRHAAENAETLRAQILANLRADENAELADIRIVWPDDGVDDAMTGFTKLFLRHFWARNGR